MPMLDVQRRHAEVFRIRIGDKDDRGNPRKLTDSIRVTSPNRLVVDAFVAVFGGETVGWNDQWQAYLPTTALPVMVLPGQSIQQWWEFYKGGVCERRCDGVTETLSGQACVCPAELTVRVADRSACSPMTRISVVCPDVEVVGAGSLVTHGMVAAETLPQAVAIAEGALSRGLMVPAVLRVVEHVGKAKRYTVPQLEIVGVSLTQLTTGETVTPAIARSERAQVAPPAPKAIAAAPPAAPAKAAAKKAAAPPARQRPPLPGEVAGGEGPNPHAKAVHILASEVAKATGFKADPLCDAAVLHATNGKTTSANALTRHTRDMAVIFLTEVRDGRLDLVANVAPDGTESYSQAAQPPLDAA